MSLLKVNEVTDLGGGVPEGVGGFTASTTITATDATFSVPALASPIVKVTAIGGGGGGGASTNQIGGAGGTTTFNAGSAGTVTAAGGAGGKGQGNTPATVATIGFASSNGGQQRPAGSENQNDGGGGRIVVGYLNLSGVSTVNVAVGDGGSAVNNASAGGRGEVILEFVAG